jgi:ribosomal protein S18 acetylase RimI-like enzyme
MTASISLRPATADDAPWIFAQVPRLHEFGPPPWRTVEQMNAGEIADLQVALTSVDDPDRLFVIAVRAGTGERVGFLYAKTQTDFFTGEPHAHIADIVVAREGEGEGVGRALMEAVQTWSRARGHRVLTLSVFPDNRRALALYERLGFRIDALRMLKVHDEA